MDSSINFNDVIEKYYKDIISTVPFKDILIDLRSVHVLTDPEVERLQKCSNDKDAGFSVLTILKSRSGEDFFRFCKILKDSDIEHIQNLGKTLEKAANKKSQDSGKLCSKLTRYF